MRRIRFYLRTLIAEYSDRTGERLTYGDLYEKAGVSTNTLSHMVNNVQQMVALNVLERLCDFFDCELHDLMRLESADEQTE